jgi:hypothetical protein
MKLKERIVEGVVEKCSKCGYKHAFFYWIEDDDSKGSEVCMDCMMEHLIECDFELVREEEDGCEVENADNANEMRK